MKNKHETEQGYIRSFDGTKLYFKRTETGTPPVIIPLASWPWYEALANDFFIISYDPRNRGRSQAVGHDTIDLEQDIKDIEVMRGHFNLDKISLIGWSMFGGVIINHTLTYGKLR